MRARLIYLRELLRASFWFVPALMGGAALILAFVLVAFGGGGAVRLLAGLGLPYAVSAEGARSILSTIAAASITVSSLVFSLTLVAMTLASQQLGPRLLANFMRDRPTQNAIGVFVAAFVYTLVVLASVSSEGEKSFVPMLAVVVALALALLSFFFLVYFIHHISMSIQADQVIGKVAAELHAAIDQFFSADPVEAVAAPEPLPDNGGAALRAVDNGYVRAIDVATLTALAIRHEAVLRLVTRPGKFVIAGQPVATIHPPAAADEADAAARAAIILGDSRTQTQDVEFAVLAIVEIAVRALSPGVNDPHTALACIDHLGAAMAHAMRRHSPPRILRDAEGRPRLLLDPLTFDGFMDAAFHEIRQNGAGTPAVAIRLAETLALLGALARIPEQTDAVRRHARLLRRAIDRKVEEESDRRDALAPLAALLADPALPEDASAVPIPKAPAAAAR